MEKAPAIRTGRIDGAGSGMDERACESHGTLSAGQGASCERCAYGRSYGCLVSGGLPTTRSKAVVCSRRQRSRSHKALHSLKILHRDLKSANIFLSDLKQTAKLGDLNVSKVAKRGLLYT